MQIINQINNYIKQIGKTNNSNYEIEFLLVTGATFLKRKLKSNCFNSAL